MISFKHIIIFAFVSICVCAQIEQLNHFKQWSKSHEKNYVSVQEEMYRYHNWLENNEFINKKNKENNGYELEMNQYGDMSWQEFKKIKMGYFSDHSNQKYFSKPNDFIGDLPRYTNWTAKNVVTDVKNQFQCGSCWAFSATGTVESMHAIKTGKLVSLSEENLIDCTFNYGNQGCDGGMPSNALDYIIANNGIDTEASYPLTSVFPFECEVQYACPCDFNRNTVGATIKGYNHIISGNETNLAYAIAFVGPVSVAIDATDSMQFYKSGVFYDKNCSSTILNHAVLAVGFGINTDGQEYYIVKNSWGTDWGLAGYILMARNKDNMCGISTNAIYPYL